jgi:hypothetical protein
VGGGEDPAVSRDEGFNDESKKRINRKRRGRRLDGGRKRRGTMQMDDEGGGTGGTGGTFLVSLQI